MSDTSPTPHGAQARGRAVITAAAVCLTAGMVASCGPRRAVSLAPFPPPSRALARDRLPQRDLPAARPVAVHVPTPPHEPRFDAVRRIVLAAAAAHTARQVSVVVYDLRRGQLFSVHPNRIFRSASIIKLAVMVAAFQARADGSLRADRFERLRPYLRRMITISDNPSTTYLLGVLGRTRVNEAMAALGFQSIHLPPQPQRGGSLAGSKATPAEVAQLLAKLAHREVVSPAASNEMLLLLGASARRKRIPAGLPARPELWVGNKTGTLNGLAHDCALVLDRSSGIGYTLAIFTEGLRSETAGDQLCRTVSRAVFEAMLEAAPARSAATRPAAAP